MPLGAGGPGISPIGRTSFFRHGDEIIPPVLYLPVRTTADGATGAMTGRLHDGQLALLAFTALDRLAGQCGDEQPWVLAGIEALAALQETKTFDRIVFDPQLPAHMRAGGKLQ